MKLIGVARLGNDAVIKYTDGGTPVANLSLAYGYGRKNEEGNRETQWIEASLWGDKAEKLEPYLKKGTAINVCLRDVRNETFDGKNRPATKMKAIVVDIEFLPKQKEHGRDNKDVRMIEDPAKKYADKSNTFEQMDDDIPF